MTRRAIFLGLLAFVLALIVVLPASWLSGLLPTGIHCAQLRGSVWKAQCLNLAISQPGAPATQIDSLRWKLRPLGLLRLTLSADVSLVRGNGSALGQLHLRSGGRIDIDQLEASGQLDRTLLSTLPAGWGGQYEIRGARIGLQGSRLLALRGTLTVHDFSDDRGTRYGNYRLEFPAQDAAPFKGALRDAGGPLDVTARVVINADRSWQVQGSIAARDALAAELNRKLDLLGAADVSGKRPLALEGSFSQ